MQGNGREVRHRHRFVAVPDAAYDARRALDPLGDELGSDLLRLVQLLVTELIGNAVSHAGMGGRGFIALDLTVDATRVRATVADGGPGFDDVGLRPLDPGAHRGRGLQLVDQIADRWGVVPGGKNRVWFEIDRARVKGFGAERAAVARPA